MKKYCLLALLMGLGCGSTPTTSSTTGGSSGGGTGGETLTINNYLSWCSVTVAGAAASTAGTQTVSEAAGAKITVTATPLASFVWGYWQGTDGDAGGATHDQGTGTDHTTTITMSGNKTIDACCPEPGQGCTF